MASEFEQLKARVAELEGVLRQIARLTLNHREIDGQAVVTAADLGDALSRVDVNWFAERPCNKTNAESAPESERAKAVREVVEAARKQNAAYQAVLTHGPKCLRTGSLSPDWKEWIWENDALRAEWRAAEGATLRAAERLERLESQPGGKG